MHAPNGKTHASDTVQNLLRDEPHNRFSVYLSHTDTKPQRAGHYTQNRVATAVSLFHTHTQWPDPDSLDTSELVILHL